MSENIKFSKQVYNKEQYSKVINTSFSQLLSQNITDQIKSQPSVNDFFTLYNTVFYLIPELGETNSHEYLIKKSSEYVNFQQDQTLINALQKEISQLRIDLLNIQKQNIDLQIQNSPASNNLINESNNLISNASNTIVNANVNNSGNNGGGGSY